MRTLRKSTASISTLIYSHTSSPGFRKKLLGACVLITLYLLFLFLFRKYGVTRERLEPVLSPLQSHGLPLLFFLQLIFSLTPIPDTFLVYMGVVIFGPTKTFLTIYASYLAATCISFSIARYFGKKKLMSRFPNMIKNIEKYDHRLKTHHLIVYRFFAFSSMDYIAYVAGFSNISFKSYFLASAITMPFLILPSILLVQGLFEHNPVLFALIYICLICLIFFTSIIVRTLEGIVRKVE